MITQYLMTRIDLNEGEFYLNELITQISISRITTVA